MSNINLNTTHVKKMAAEYEERVKLLQNMSKSKSSSKYIEVPLVHEQNKGEVINEINNDNNDNKDNKDLYQDYDLKTVNIMITDIINNIVETHNSKIL
jgi:hypothetical protein